MTAVARDQDDEIVIAEGDVLVGDRNVRLRIAEIDADRHGAGVCIESADGVGGVIRYWMPREDLLSRLRSGRYRKLSGLSGEDHD